MHEEIAIALEQSSMRRHVSVRDIVQVTLTLAPDAVRSEQ